ncbi:hypothetical protein [Gilvibacter sediminis]|uniref:hypothetical protein n=1 Tax=Gilvibacter sediminis TaxID=379071 RepID=UPI002350223E|nr:hypothetical protein [Gilvibacter sediminis]MDC7997023.1 hypothetical protein [Gilvibacter sediminis]
MSKRDLIYWRRGFNYTREDHGYRVIIETYRLLSHYCEENTNCRFGGYFIKKSFSEFYSFNQLTPSFDSFIQFANSDELMVDSRETDFFKELNGTNFLVEVQDALKLKRPMRFEYSTKNFINDILGYKFNSPMSIIIEPQEILCVEGENLDSFRVITERFSIKVNFRYDIQVF